MGNLWLKIKVWTKIVIASAIGLYVLIFILKNGGRTAPFWFWFYRDDEHSLLFLVLLAFVIGVVVTILAMTTLRTLRQVKDLRSRSRSERLEREISDMKSKAAMLQTKPAARAAGGSSSSGVMEVEPPPNTDPASSKLYSDPTDHE